MQDSEEQFGGLGSLAQSSRLKQLKSARVILFVVGVLTLLANGAIAMFAESLVESQFEKELIQVRQQGMEVDPVVLAELKEEGIRSVQLAGWIGAALGFVFILMGFFLYSNPVVITISALALYIGSAAVYGAIDPSTLKGGWWIKILIVVGLFKAVQAALAYEKERKAETDAAFDGMQPLA